MCSQCGYSGFISAFSKKTGAIFAFRSMCSIADERNISLKIPVWSDVRLKDYSFDPVIIGIDKAKSGSEKTVETVIEVTPPPESKTVVKDYKVLAADPHAYDEDDLPFN